jgi:CRISPR-associated endonuclease/helicase Cas3
MSIDLEPECMTIYFAHSANKAGSPWESLKEHTHCVAKRAARYASAFNAAEEARIAGLWHDLGKYSDVFIKRLRREVSGLDHWSIGAIATLYELREKAIAAALAIQGHHIGLQEGSVGNIRDGLDLSKLSDAGKRPDQLSLTEADWKLLLKRFMDDGFQVPTPPPNSLYDFKAPHIAAMLDARMLFSALVDADYVETEAHFEGDSDGTKNYRPTGPDLQAEPALRIITEHLAKLETESSASTKVQSMRRLLLEDCLNSATHSHGIFTLTAPTGAGKTLAMLAFALKHAVAHPEIRRIVMVVPFLSIIEQTADVYRKLLEPHFEAYYVLEHHSLAGVGTVGEDTAQDRDNEEEAKRTAGLLTENWDAPLILTTSVQFFESLFANRPANCRKLHRLANSIIMFDEVQTLPPRIAVPSLAALSRLSERYGCTVVFSTATQPAFDQLHDKVKSYAELGWKPQTITPKPQRLFTHARRVNINWQIDDSRSWKSIADELERDENARSLCVVNLKRHATRLVSLLRDKLGVEGLFHLSTNMCPAHRRKVLSEVRERLKSADHVPCRLISTQCVEAGVDVDFPVVWRALGPLDGIAQAAGRCNREGRLNRKGRMVVFLPERERSREYLYPPGGYKEATETTKTLFEMKRIDAKEKGISFEKAYDIYNPDLFNEYYGLLYDLTGMAEFNPDDNELADAIHRRSFVDVSKEYQLIPQQSVNVLVPYKDELSKFEELNERLTKQNRLTREWIHEARPLTISIYRPKDGDPVWQYLESAPLGRGGKADDWFIYLNPEDYDPLLGLNPKNEVDAWTI